jgi:FkbM family methyltransferase
VDRSSPLAALRRRAHRLVRSAGLDVVRYQPLRFPELRRARAFERRSIDLVLDVGANDGSYAADLRAAGYGGAIVSFEPQSRAFDRLARYAAADPGWQCRRIALGSQQATEVVLNLAGNSSSSSLLPMSERHVESAPESQYVGTETVELTTLDAIAPELLGTAERICLKVDVQGLELDVLRGAEETLQRVDLLDVELSLVPLYEGAPEALEVLSYVADRGFRLLDVEPVFLDPVSGEVLQVNGLCGRDR